MKIVSIAERIAFINRTLGKGESTRDGRNYDIRCPICKDPDKSKRKLSINTSNDLNQCWVCGWSARNLLALLKRFGTSEDVREYRETFLGVQETSQHEGTKFRPKLPSDFKLLALECKTLAQRRVMNYLISRGLTKDDLWKFRFGTSEEDGFQGRVIFPSFDARGDLNYYTARAVERYVKKRYMNPPGRRDDVIFNELFVDWKRELVLCEGPFDSTKCGDNVVPLLGNRLSERSNVFSKILENETPVVVALDPQEQTKIHALVRLLGTYGIQAKAVDLGDAKDPGDMTKDGFAHALKDSRELTWMDTFNMKLSRAAGVNLNTHID